MESDTSVASKAAPKPAAQTTVAKPPKQLDPQPKLPKSCETSFEKVKTPCSTTFGEVIYATKEQMFYLLPDRAATSIKEAMKELEDHLSAGKSPEERQKAMNKLGLLEYFLEPKLANFLEGEQRSRMLEIEKQEPYIDQPTMAMRIKAAKREAEYAAKAQGRKNNPTPTSVASWPALNRISFSKPTKKACIFSICIMSGKSSRKSLWHRLKKRATSTKTATCSPQKHLKRANVFKLI